MVKKLMVSVLKRGYFGLLVNKVLLLLMIKGPQILTSPVTIGWSVGYRLFRLLNAGAPTGTKSVQKGNSFQL